MSISLIGIISVQLYWSKNAIDSKDVQFGGDVKKALARVSERLQIKEQDLYYNKIQNFIETKRFLNKAQIKNFLIQQIDTTTKSRFSFGTTIIEEDFKIPVLDILDKNGFYDNDSIVVKSFLSRSSTLSILENVLSLKAPLKSLSLIIRVPLKKSLFFVNLLTTIESLS